MVIGSPPFVCHGVWPFGRETPHKPILNGDLLQDDPRMETSEMVLLMAKILHHLGDINLVNNGINHLGYMNYIFNRE